MCFIFNTAPLSLLPNKILSHPACGYSYHSIFVHLYCCRSQKRSYLQKKSKKVISADGSIFGLICVTFYVCYMPIILAISLTLSGVRLPKSTFTNMNTVVTISGILNIFVYGFFSQALQKTNQKHILRHQSQKR